MDLPTNYPTTGEDNIWNIIQRFYDVDRGKDPASAQEIYDLIALANPHVIHLETLNVGQALYLPARRNPAETETAPPDAEDKTPTQQLKAVGKKTTASSD